MNRKWYVLWARPKFEERVACQLRDRGIEIFFPKVKSRKSPWKGAMEPLFSCYIFSRFDIASEELLIVRSSPGVRDILGMHDAPTPVPDHVVLAISDRVEQENTPGFQRSFCSGQRVIIGNGPFKDLEAIFDRRLSASGRARVFVQMVGKIWPVQIESIYLRTAS